MTDDNNDIFSKVIDTGSEFFALLGQLPATPQTVRDITAIKLATARLYYEELGMDWEAGVSQAYSTWKEGDDDGYYIDLDR